MNVADQLPRVFQANADRFYQCVVLRALGDLPTHDALVVGQTRLGRVPGPMCRSG